MRAAVGRELVDEVGQLDTEVGGLRPPAAVERVGTVRVGEAEPQRNPRRRGRAGLQKMSSAPLGRPREAPRWRLLHERSAPNLPSVATGAVRRHQQMGPLPSRGDQVPRVEAPARPRAGRDRSRRSGRARPWTCSPARRGWPRSSRRRGIEVTATDLASYSEVLSDCYIATDAAGVDRRALVAELARLNGLPGESRVRHPDVLRAVAVLPAAQRPPHRRDPGRDRERPPDGSAAADPAHLAAAGGRPRGLDDRAADGLPQAVVAALAPRPRAAGARAARRAGAHRPRRCDADGGPAAAGRT